MHRLWRQHPRVLSLALGLSLLATVAAASGLVVRGGREAAPRQARAMPAQSRLDRPSGLKTVLVHPRARPTQPPRPGVMPKAGNAVGGGDGPTSSRVSSSSSGSTGRRPQ